MQQTSNNGRTRRSRVLLVDDHEVVRFGIRTLFNEMLGVSLDWLEAECLHDAIEVYAREPDIEAVLLDMNLPDSKGLQGLRAFLERHPRARIAIFSGTHDEFVVRQARALGAMGFVSKGASIVTLGAMIGALLRPSDADERTPTTTPGELFPLAPASALEARVTELGPRQLEILELVLSGCSNQEISNTMRLSLGTTKNYVSSLLLAMEVKSRAHLVSLFR